MRVLIGVSILCNREVKRGIVGEFEESLPNHLDSPAGTIPLGPLPGLLTGGTDQRGQQNPFDRIQEKWLIARPCSTGWTGEETQWSFPITRA